jgi:protein MBA1
VRVLSDRATQLPEVAKSGIRQIVLRVSSRQSMTKASNSKDVAAQPAKQQDVTEYVVIQQLIWNGKDAGWRVWGNTKPTTMEQVWHDPSFAPGMTALERLDAMKDFMK